MKRIFVFVLVVVLALSQAALAGTSALESFDFSLLTLEDLQVLKTKVDEAYANASAEVVDGYKVIESFSEYARNPDAHIGEKIRFNGTVLQVIEGIEQNKCRVAVNGNSDNVFYVSYKANNEAGRLLEDDAVTVMGTFDGMVSYEAVLGNTITIPSCAADKIIDKISEASEYPATRSEPAPINATIRYDGSHYSNEAVTDFTITKVIRGDSAWQMIKKFNRYNDAPASNQEYVIVYIKAKAISSENDQQAEIDSYDFTLVSASGMEYQKAYVSGATPELTNLYPGAEHEGVYVGLIEKGDSPLLVYLKSSYEPIWFDLNKRAPITLPDDIVLNTLAKGSKGAEVQNMQAALVEMGYLNGNPDGDFGGITEAAVIEYQQAMGIEATGIADEATLRLILTYTTP